MSTQVSKARKALAAPLAPVLLALLMWASTGTLNLAEFAVALSGFVAAAIVYYVPNADNSRAADPSGRH